jgi:hypothetical protein
MSKPKPPLHSDIGSYGNDDEHDKFMTMAMMMTVIVKMMTYPNS